MYTQKSCHCPDASAGPNERVVFSDAPLSGPNAICEAQRPGRATARAPGGATATTGTHKTVAETDHKVAVPLHDPKKKVAIAAVKPAPARPAHAKPAPPATANATTAKKK